MKFILCDQSAINEEDDGMILFYDSLKEAQEMIDHFVKDNLSEDYINGLVILEIKSQRAVHLNKQGIINKPDLLK